jgi:hypothetical protein
LLVVRFQKPELIEIANEKEERYLCFVREPSAQFSAQSDAFSVFFYLSLISACILNQIHDSGSNEGDVTIMCTALRRDV